MNRAIRLVRNVASSSFHSPLNSLSQTLSNHAITRHHQQGRDLITQQAVQFSSCANTARSDLRPCIRLFAKTKTRRTPISIINNNVAFMRASVARYASNSANKDEFNSRITSKLQDYLHAMKKRQQELDEELREGSEGMKTGQFAAKSKELSRLNIILQKHAEFESAKKEFAALREMIQDPSTDSELKQLAIDEQFEKRIELEKKERELLTLILPKDEAEERNAILEVRPGTGGDEATLFTMELFNLYRKFAKRRGWKFEVLTCTSSDVKGYKDATALISGSGVYGALQFESGVHRVQRVPETETLGRVHTSTATVAILPEAEDVDVQIEMKDLRIDTYRASGAGGQHVNTTDSAVRITHIPTGTVVAIQDQRSQHQNKERAMKVLRSRLFEMQRAKVAAERAAARAGQVGRGNRNERIRTYNFPQERITDHRVNLTLHGMEKMMEGELLDEFIEALQLDAQTEQLAAFSAEANSNNK
eukprot:GEZU01003147.1.p1 GENE.GEZU01003147.1~~GEZU01003147.1.p1  ORF type:complete len:478 (-),score=105.04 GEZU01003147.1:78-1511(-)